MHLTAKIQIVTKDQHVPTPEELLNLEMWLNFQVATRCYSELGFGIRFHLAAEETK